MSSILIILIGFGISAVLTLTVWLASKNIRKRNRIQSEIEKQKAEIIMIIDEALGNGLSLNSYRKIFSPDASQIGFPVLGKLFMGLTLLPFLIALVFAGVHGQNKPKMTTYTVGLEPRGICFDGTNIWVVNQLSNRFTNGSVTKLRVSDGKILGTYAVGAEPYAICFDDTNIWVTNSGSDSVTKLRASDGTVLGTYTVGIDPIGICFDGTNIWVINFNNTDVTNSSVTKLRTSDGITLGTYKLGSGPSSICFDGTNIWVTNNNKSVTNVTKLRASDGTILGNYAVGTQPQSICFDGTNIWVANFGSNNVTKLRANDGTILGTYPVGNNPMAICFDGTNIWVANTNNNKITRLRASDGSILGTYAVGNRPNDLCFDGASIWVTNSGSDSVTKLPKTIMPTATTTTAPTSMTTTTVSSSSSSKTTTTTTPTATLSSVTIAPASPSHLPVGYFQVFIASGTYSDGRSGVDISSQVTWTSSDTNIATISARGTATALAVGSTKITAALSGITSQTVTLTVITATPTPITTTSTTTSGLFPANGATGVPVSGVTFTWPLVAAPAGSTITYQFALAQASANTSANEFAILDYSDNTITNAEPLQENLQYNTVYWWEIRTVTMNSSGGIAGTGPWTIQMFVTATK